MKSLSGLDATFLYLETPQTPMHVASLCLYEPPRGLRGSFARRVREHIAARMHLAPIFSRRLAFMPFDLGHPLWVEADKVDLEFHIRRIGEKLTVKQARAKAAELHGQLIDREHPLWEFHVFEHVIAPAGEGKTRRLVGMYSKIHHAALDGKGGTVLANAMLDLQETPRDVAPPDPARRGRSSGELKVGRLIGAVFSNSLAQYAKLAKSLPAVAGAVGGALARQTLPAAGASKAGAKARMPLRLAPRTPFNTGITADRAFATVSLPFASCRAMSKAVGGSFNDIVLWICSTALREFLLQQKALPKKSLVAAMPVSLREQSNTELNNQASISLVELGTHLAHPLKRMNAIMTSTGKVKDALASLKSVLPTDYPSLLAPWLVGGVARAALKAYGGSGLADRLPMIANLAISNVPGPQAPLYLAGARMLTFHPLSIVMHGLALNITIQTYAGSVDFGLLAGRRAVPHLDRLAAAIQGAYDEACRLYAMGESSDARDRGEPAARPQRRPAAAGARAARA